jgi:hypothetical protein
MAELYPRIMCGTRGDIEDKKEIDIGDGNPLGGYLTGDQDNVLVLVKM